MKYTYRKSDGEDIWTVGHDDNGEWIPESDWGSDGYHEGDFYAELRADFLNGRCLESLAVTLIKRIEEMHEGYEKGLGQLQTTEYYRGAADACGLILDLPELRLFLPAKGENK